MRSHSLARHAPSSALLSISLVLIQLGYGPRLEAAVSGPLLDAARWTVEDLVRGESASDWDVASDGSFAVWLRSTVETVDEEEKRISRLWLSPIATDASDPKPRPLTRAKDDIDSPRLSPDDRHVAFLSSRELPGGDKGEQAAKTQLWVLPLAGGEAFPVTRFEREPEGFGWIDASTLVVAAEESPSAWERERKRRKDTAEVVEDAERKPPVRLFRVPLKGGAKRLTTNTDWIDALAVSPDGRQAVISAQQSLSYEFDQAVPPQTFVVDLATGERTRLELTDEGSQGGPESESGPESRPWELLPFDVQWALDGSGFYFADAYTTHPRYRNATVSRLYFYDLATARASRVELDWDRGLGGDYAPTRDGLIALLADGVRYRPVRFVRQSSTGEGSGASTRWLRADLAGEHTQNLDEWVLSEDGETLVYRHSKANLPAQWYAARLEEARLRDLHAVTDLNPDWKDKPTGRVDVVRFTGARGDEVEGLLHYPLDWREGGRRPLILDIHGGPNSADRDSWDQRWATPGILWRQQGAFILQVNYHGSSDYGLEWVESIEGRYYELEIPDIEAGVDHVIARGLADPDRLATSGWSNGGILSAELITRSDRYKAASVGAADVEWISDWANVDFGAAFDNYYFGGPPWEIPQTYIDKSPFFRLTEVTTPTIVYTGTEDRNVPPHQSWSLFRALQQIGEAPVRLVLFPGEPHGLRKVAHQRRKLEEDLAWFDRHLFKKEPEKGEAVRDGSPLAGLLARTSAARVGDAVGREISGHLVPETVASGAAEGWEIGRFEVTRAQWVAFKRAAFEGAAFDGTDAPAEPNLPATGMTFEDAQRYVAWLSMTTGETWRLPTEREAKALAEAASEAGDASDGGNTLDRWAGYTPNPEDRARLLEALGEEGGPGAGALLLPVGSLAGAGEPMVFDLDGNVAEWALGDHGEGVAVGPSADRSTEEASQVEPAPDFTGLRVIREPGPLPSGAHAG